MYLLTPYGVSFSLGEFLMVLTVVSSFLIAYLIGSIPVGLFIVRIFTGKDVRQTGSGRSGGTNAMRAAGLFAGLLTAAFDLGKGILTGYIAGLLVPGSVWVKVISLILAVLGQIYSVFLIEKNESGKITLRGGAGGSTTLGGAIALFPMSWIVILPMVILVFITIGYASITTISIALYSLLLFLTRAATGIGPWEYIVYGVITLITVTIALKPNLQRLREGTERAVGLRAYFQKKTKLTQQ
jgi:glycerol-3-phosphate acyltransferase PlsY